MPERSPLLEGRASDQGPTASKDDPSSLPVTRCSLLLLCLAALFLFSVGLCARGFTDNEGMYAEIAREILITGDWVTPHLNGALYLNKPPLLFWLTAVMLKVTGLNEWPRLISGLGTLGTMLLVYDLGRRIWPQRPGAGIWAAAVYLSSAFTPIEARILRPDSLLTFFLCLTLWGVVRVSGIAASLHTYHSPPGAADRLGVAAIWAGIGLGVMVKGLLGFLLPVLVVCPALLLGPQWKEIRRCSPAWWLLLAALIILPWHIAAGLVNRGFWRDYVVNQHLLYFFDRKFPRDSVSQPLWLVWAAFAARLAPWTLLLPAAVVGQVRRARSEGDVTAWLPLTWLAMIGLFFSLSKGRLVHYFLPAVPAAALLVGRLCEEWARSRGQWGSDASSVIRHQPPLTNDGSRMTGHASLRGVPFLLLTLAGLAGLMAAPGLLRGSGILDSAPTLLPLARGAFVVVGIGSLAATSLALARRLSLALGTVVGTFLVFAVFACRGLDAADDAASARQPVMALDRALLAQSTVAYEAGTEYQLCGALNFYLRRRLLILEPPGYVPPTYLQGHMDDLFVKRDRFWSEWRQAKRRFLLFTDPDKPLDRPGDFPAPCYEVGRGGGRLLLTNLPLPGRAAYRSRSSARRTDENE